MQRKHKKSKANPLQNHRTCKGNTRNAKQIHARAIANARTHTRKAKQIHGRTIVNECKGNTRKTKQIHGRGIVHAKETPEEASKSMAEPSKMQGKHKKSQANIWQKHSTCKGNIRRGKQIHGRTIENARKIQEKPSKSIAEPSKMQGKHKKRQANPWQNRSNATVNSKCLRPAPGPASRPGRPARPEKTQTDPNFKPHPLSYKSDDF